VDVAERVQAEFHDHANASTTRPVPALSQVGALSLVAVVDAFPSRGPDEPGPVIP